jgi:simple sugar transport system permease protein
MSQGLEQGLEQEMTKQEETQYLEDQVLEIQKKGGPRKVMLEILSSKPLLSFLSIVSALVIGAVLIIIANPDVQRTAGYLFARPGDFFSACWNVIRDAYSAMFSGAIVDFNAPSFFRFIKPLTDTLAAATPLVFTGLGLGVGFRASLFNIGGQGQIICGSLLSALAGFSLNLPLVLQLPICIIMGAVGGAIWGFIPGILKAKTKANEVIVTIMLNYIALYFLQWVLSQPVFQKLGQNVPIAKPMNASAIYPPLFGPLFKVNFSFVLAIVAVVVFWWLMERSQLGFRLKAVGYNPNAAKNAGMKVDNIFMYGMIISGAFCGLAGTSQVLVGGTGMGDGVASTFGFDAITVALLGRSKPLGTLLSALLFGALRAGGYVMQSKTGTPIDVVQIIQSVIVMFIAAPPLVRAIFHLPKPVGLNIAEEVA